MFCICSSGKRVENEVRATKIAAVARRTTALPSQNDSLCGDRKADFVLPGASGTGRTTFVNTLCESEVLAHKVSDDPATAHVEQNIRIKPVNVGACSLHPK